MKLEEQQMMFTGNLIEDLIATVERAEQAQDEILAVDSVVHDAWLASMQEVADYDTKLFVA